MYKRIDGVEEAPNGFTYVNKHGFVEGVHLDTFTADIGTVEGSGSISEDGFTVYVDDIPLLVRALQSAYAQSKGY